MIERLICMDIKGSNDWVKIEKIEKGWSSDSKYLITTQEGKLLSLRISNIEHYDNFQRNMPKWYTDRFHGDNVNDKE